MPSILTPQKKVAEVARALVESYINMRISSWGVPDEEFDWLPEQTSTPGLKAKACKEILEDIDKFEANGDWAELSYCLDKKEKAEDNYESRNAISRMLNYFYDSSKLLRETIHTIISYGNAELDNSTLQKNLKHREEELQAYIADTTNRKQYPDEVKKKTDELNKIQRTLIALNVKKDTMDTYFNHEIKVNDPFAKTLNEEKFANFVEHATNGKRPKKYCDKLLNPRPKPAPEVKATEVKATEVKAKEVKVENVVDQKAKQPSSMWATPKSETKSDVPPAKPTVEEKDKIAPDEFQQVRRSHRRRN